MIRPASNAFGDFIDDAVSELIARARPQLLAMVRTDMVPAAMAAATPAVHGLVTDALGQLHADMPQILADVRTGIPAAVQSAIGAVPMRVKVGAAVVVLSALGALAFSSGAWVQSRRCARPASLRGLWRFRPAVAV